MRRLRLRSRLTLGTAVLAAVGVAVALALARVEVSRLLHDSSIALARSDTTSFAVEIRSNRGEAPDAVAAGLFIVIRDPSGAVVVDTAPDEVRAAIVRRAVTNTSFDVGDDEGRAWEVVSRPVRTAGGEWSIWAAREVTASKSAVSAIDDVFVLVGLGLLLLIVAGSWMLVGRALRPVEQLRRGAEGLGENEFLEVYGDDELARLGRTLNDLVRRVRRSAARERRMVSDAAHELRTPLAAVRAELELAARAAGDPTTVAERVESARRSVDRMESLATNLLALARLDELGPSDVSTPARVIAHELLGAVDRARTTVAGQAIEIDDSVQLASPDALYGLDSIAVARILDNLLANAVRAVGDGGKIGVKLDDHLGELVCQVEDNGPGAPEGFLAVAFERFTQAESSRSGTGSGLGLAVVLGLAQSARGTVRVENLHPGFRVTVQLPKM